MKKTLTINLNSFEWTINDDAYEFLKSYLDELETIFSSNDEKEILNDIEARISELFSERMGKNRTVVELSDVEYVISILGKACDFSETENVAEKSQERRFYRDADDKIIGGVASGLAIYLGWNVVAMRVVFLLLGIFLFRYILPIYLIIWLITSEAKTPIQKLKMRGKNITAENIKNIKTQIKENVPEPNSIRSFVGSVAFWVKKILKWILIILGSFLGLSVVFTCVLAFLGLLVAIVCYFAAPQYFPFSIMEYPLIIFVVSLFLLFAIPIVGGIWLIVRILKKKKLSNKYSWLIWTIFIVWFLSIFTLIFSSIKLCNSEQDFSTVKSFVTDKVEVYESESRQVTAFNSIVVSDAMKIELTQSDSCKVRVNSDSNKLPYIKTEVKDSVLYVYRDLNTSGNVVIEASLPKIKHLNVKEASKIEGENIFVESEFSLSVKDASDVEISLDSAKNIVLDVDNASKVELSGFSDLLSMKVRGASKTDLSKLQVKVADVTIKSASKSKIWASDSIYFHLSGASKLKYKGNPNVQGSSQPACSIKMDNE